MKREESFGVVPLSQKMGVWEVFLIQHKRGRYWGFPKGHAEGDESPLDTAFRELKEETNLDFVRLLHEEPFTEQYQFLVEGEKVFKQVLYFLAEVSGSVRLQAAEIQSGQWLALPDAIQQITHAEGKTILAEVAKILSKG
ncbi:MAG: NUDIX domain-containing protein [Chlamydiia bacterium]|nr:NUDIX domain-containing protein [Chlamydiia bacterium]